MTTFSASVVEVVVAPPWWYRFMDYLVLQLTTRYEIRPWKCGVFNPFQTAAPFWAQTTRSLSGMPRKRGCRPENLPEDGRTAAV